MRISLNELHQIENYLLKTGDPSDRLLVEAKMNLNHDFNQKILAQKSAYALIRIYGKSRLLNDIKSVENQLFRLPKHKRFSLAIQSLFSK